MDGKIESSVEAHSRQDTWTNTPLHNHSTTSTITHRHVNASDKIIKFIGSDREVPNFRRIQTNWTNFTSCSKYYEDQLDHDLLDEVNQTIHLLLTTRHGLQLQEVASCRFHVHPRTIDEHSTRPQGSEHDGHSQFNCGQIEDVYLNPDFLKLEGDRANDALYGILESLLNTLANTLQHLQTERHGMHMMSNIMSDCRTNSMYAGWKVEDKNICGPIVSADKNVLDHILKSHDSHGKVGNHQERIVSSSYQFAHSRKDFARLGAQTESLLRARSTILSQNNIPKEDPPREQITARALDKQCIPNIEQVNTSCSLGMHCISNAEQEKTTEFVIVQAILAFMDIFEDALESPEIPLMQLDADSLVLNELADALSKSSKQSVKVVDLFSSGRNTCAGLLRFLSCGTRGVKTE